MSDFVVDGIKFVCMEQYMMAYKAKIFNDIEVYNKILSTIDPKEIKLLGRAVKNFDSEIWDSVKFDIVYNGNLAKFSQNAALKDFLLSLGDVILAEASPYDTVWGIGMKECEVAFIPDNWLGQNLLGLALTKVKETLQNLQKDKF